jgi:putative molybdopterin biosynthesis protein
MSAEMMSTKEVAAYLNLNEKKVYALVKQAQIPCTKVTGKWVFPKPLVDGWIEESVRIPGAGHRQNILITGSHDPCVELLAEDLNSRFPELIMLAANIGSTNGISALKQGRCHIAGAHLLDPESNEYNFPYLRHLFSGRETVVVCFVHREQGLIVKPGNPMNVNSLEDLCRGDVRFVNRQQGAGTRVLLDHHLKRMGIADRDILGYDHQVATHTEVATEVKGGRADVGLGVRAAATAFDLEFVPLAKERYDFIIPKQAFYTEPLQKVMDVVRSDRFAEQVLQMGGYDVSEMGSVLSWS